MTSLSAAVARGAAMAEDVDGGALVVTGTTPGIEFGIDAFSWELGPQFEGLAGLAPGLHLLSLAPKGGVAGREGVWIACEGGTTTLKAWDAANECVARQGASSALSRGSLASLERAARDGSCRLAPYPDGHSAVWRGLSSRITVGTLDRCGLSLDTAFGPGSLEDEEVDDGDDAGCASWTRCDARTLRRLGLGCPPPGPRREGKGGFRRWPVTSMAGVSPSAGDGRARAPRRRDPRAGTTDLLAPRAVPGPDATAFFGPDASRRVEALVAASFGGDFGALVAEFELAFVVFVCLGSFRALRQWQTGPREHVLQVYFNSRVG